MNTFIDEIYSFYQNPQNIKDFEEWQKERNKRNDDTSIKSERKTS